MTTMKRCVCTFTALYLALLPFSAEPARADVPFDPNLIISDQDLTNTKVPDDFAQKFLVAHGGGIAGMKFKDIDGITEKSPGDIVTHYGKIYGVNPRFLLALIQKEQSLVDDPSPSRCQIDWATGYNRPDGSYCDQNRSYSGFTQQIIGAAAFVQYFYQKDAAGQPRAFGYNPGAIAIIDGHPLIPANVATAMLYSYTPHLHGNQMLARLWSNWFTSTYPDGSYLSDGEGNAYVIEGGQKRLFANKSALYSRVSASRVIQVGADVLAQYPDDAPIKFAEYSLVRVPSGTVYLLVRDVKRPIESMRVFRNIGFNPEEIDNVVPADLKDYADGDPITIKSAYPTGALLQEKKTGGVFYVEAGVKYPIYSAEIMKTDFPGRKLSPVSKSVLDGYPTGDPVKFRDGELVTSPGSGSTVFVISNGLRRPIVSGEVFEALGYTWDRVIHTNENAINLHPLGPPVTQATSAPATLASAH